MFSSTVCIRNCGYMQERNQILGRRGELKLDNLEGFSLQKKRIYKYKIMYEGEDLFKMNQDKL
jgi:hypothetical protein